MRRPTILRPAAAVAAAALVTALSACGEGPPISVRGPSSTAPAPAPTEPPSPSTPDTATASMSLSTSPPSSPPETLPSMTAPPSGGETSHPTDTGEGASVTVDGRTITDFPPGLPFPAAVKVSSTMAQAPGAGTVAFSAPDESHVLAHYRALLPKAGYRVLADTGGTLAFTGKGYRGSLTGLGGAGAVLTWSTLTP